MIDYEKLKERILTHRANIASGALDFMDDAIADGYLMALDDILTAMDEIRLCWTTSNDEPINKIEF